MVAAHVIMDLIHSRLCEEYKYLLLYLKNNRTTSEHSLWVVASQGYRILRQPYEAAFQNWSVPKATPLQWSRKIGG